jgi:hypothetical protein
MVLVIRQLRLLILLGIFVLVERVQCSMRTDWRFGGYEVLCDVVYYGLMRTGPVCSMLCCSVSMLNDVKYRITHIYVGVSKVLFFALSHM